MKARDEINRSRAQRTWSWWHTFDKQDTWVSGLGVSPRGRMFGMSSIFWIHCGQSPVCLMKGLPQKAHNGGWRMIGGKLKPTFLGASILAIQLGFYPPVTIATEVFGATRSAQSTCQDMQPDHVTTGEFWRSVMDLPSQWLLRRVGKPTQMW